MRTIKFRVYDKEDKKYLYPDSQSFVIVPTRPSFGVTLSYENRRNPDNIDEDCFDWADADLLMGRYELEQYTGLKDKNDQDIYEGDIVKESDGWIHDVHWSEDEVGSCGCCVDEFWGTGFVISKHSDPSSCEVIGNIHENPELK